MSVITFTTSLKVGNFSWMQFRNDNEFRSNFGVQSVELSAALWQVNVGPPELYDVNAGEWEALILRLRGKVNQLEIWNVMRPAPFGTMRGSMTLRSAIAAGATTLPIVAAGQNAKTILRGDFLGLGSATTQQVCMAAADATSDGSGNIDVIVEPPVRNAFAISSVVTWDKPKALFRRSSAPIGWEYSGITVTGFNMELLEDWRP